MSEAAPASAWQPRIVAIVCNWCTYAGADMAGTMRRTYPASARMLRVPCSGRVSPLFLLRAFEQGADGVLVSGCHPGDCHYTQGNLFARRRFAVFRTLAEFLGLDPRRVHFSWVSASEGLKWARVVEQVTARVREAGPLEDWGRRPAGPPAPGPPEPPAPPRPDPAVAEMDAVTGHLRSLAARLLAEGQVSLVLGYGDGPLPGRTAPAFVAEAKDTTRLAFNEHAHANLAVYLAGDRRPEGRVAVVLKACDERAVRGLMREGQLRREDLVLIGVSCPGVWEDGKLALKCYACDGEVPPTCDFTVHAGGASPGAVRSDGPRAVAPDPRDAQIAWVESLGPRERWAFWQEQFALCLRCYACRAVCPLCYCGSCISDQHRPQWIPTAIDGRGNTAWNVVRAYHLAGRCAGCDECARACPARIRLDLINRRLAKEIEDRFGHRVGDDPATPPPLATFRPDDPQEFIG
jgi:coenzyme F420-reducing hydrogenase delta subunit/ferredoxin